MSMGVMCTAEWYSRAQDHPLTHKHMRWLLGRSPLSNGNAASCCSTSALMRKPWTTVQGWGAGCCGGEGGGGDAHGYQAALLRKMWTTVGNSTITGWTNRDLGDQNYDLGLI